MFLPPQLDACWIKLKSLINITKFLVEFLRIVVNLPKGFIEFSGVGLETDRDAVGLLDVHIQETLLYCHSFTMPPFCQRIPTSIHAYETFSPDSIMIF